MELEIPKFTLMSESEQAFMKILTWIKYILSGHENNESIRGMRS